MPSEFLEKFRLPFLVLLSGIAMVSIGVLIYKSKSLINPSNVEIIESSPSGSINTDLTVEISGEVLNPGVYKLPIDSRVEDLIKASGGFTDKSDQEYISKYLNRASKLVDGQKVYISQSNGSSAKLGIVDQSRSGEVLGQNQGLVNINTATVSELDKLPGIGPVYAQKIIDQRPYSKLEELTERDVIGSSLFEKIKSLVSVY